MSLKAKLLLAQAPLALALALLGIFSGAVTTALGQEARLILADNYRSVLAAERMKEALERINSAALVPARRPATSAVAEIAANREPVRGRARRAGGQHHRAGRGGRHARSCADAWNDYAARARRASQARRRRARARGPYFSRARAGFTARQPARGPDPRHQPGRHGAQGRPRPSARAADFEHLVVVAVVLALALGLAGVGVAHDAPAAAARRRRRRPCGASARTISRARRRARRATRSPPSPPSSTAWPTASSATARARSASCCRRSRRRRRPSTACPIRCCCSTPTGDARGRQRAPATRLLGIDPDRPRAPRSTRTPIPCVRAVVERLRAHVLGGKGAVRAQGLRGGRARRDDARRRAHPPAARHAHLQRGGRRHGRRDRAAGLDAPASASTSSRTISSPPSRTSSARR